MKFFKKKHLILKSIKNKFINKLTSGLFGLYFLKTGHLKFVQFKAIVFFLKKHLKPFSKIFLRVSKSIKYTKKPIGVRMGKGKGSLEDYYLTVNAGQMFIEFFFSSPQNLNFLIIKKIKKIVFLVNKKLNLKLGLVKK